ncbi:MAG: ATP-binding cassette domain-containing protein [Defluviitaleaceae bacterium]|nr:ATP-binding cassette domain-containing protein [Defluviitaleaceae bacterium]
MIDISVHELNKYYGSNHVIKGVSFEIYAGEKVGLLGKNGSGKTTLFKVIAGDEYYESGNVSKASGKKVEILAQIPVFSENDTVEDILRSSFKEVAEIYETMKKIEGDGDPAVLKRYGKLMEDYERLGGYDVEMKIEKMCNGMNIDNEMRSSLFSLLSGGEKTRVNLARILLLDCDILLLDEPTNHLDLASLAWLENFIRKYSGTVVVISHDRVFLDNVITRIIEIDNGKANFYSGNFSWYAEERQRRFITQSQQYERQQKEIKRIEDRAKWFLVNDRFTTKHHAILSRIDHMEKIEKPVTSKKITEDFNSGGHAAKVVVSLDSVSKSYDSNVILNNVSLNIDRNNRIALIGANGCGKTTLLKLIMGEEPCDSGVVKVSSNVKIAYMSQIIVFEDENATVLETLRSAVELPQEKLRSILARFRFTAPDILKKVGNLSGGEKSRLKLCLLMQNQVNFLILDEPTNHLDIESREWIEDAVSEFNGTMLFISHDGFFLNKFASKIWNMKNGEITEFDGGYDNA